jgi:hypothetical protein
MNTKTLRPITLPTGEVKMRTVTAPPVEPAPDLLVRSLAEYAKSIEGLELIKTQAERAKAEEEAALSSETLSDEELTIKVIGAKRAQNIYASREGAMAEALSQLETLIGTARQELSMLVTEKRNREREILARKAFEAYGVPAEGRTELFERLLRRSIAALLSLALFTGRSF